MSFWGVLKINSSWSGIEGKGVFSGGIVGLKFRFLRFESYKWFSGVGVRVKLDGRWSWIRGGFLSFLVEFEYYRVMESF